MNLPSFEQIKVKKSFLISAGIIIVFLMVIYSYLFNLEVTKDDIPNYSELTADPYQKFEKNVSSDEVRNLVEDNQLKSIKYYEDIIKEKNCPERENPFKKSF